MKHGVHAPTYRSWQMMKNRCLNPNATDFDRYGGRGISVCDAWMTYEGFVASMGTRPDGTTLDRRAGRKGYTKKNCRWATRKVQSQNRDYTLTLIHDGRSMKVWEWAAALHINPKTMHHRLWKFRSGEITWSAVFVPNPRKVSK